MTTTKGKIFSKNEIFSEKTELLTKQEIFKRLKEDGVNLGNDPVRTFRYYEETGIVPSPEGKTKRNAFLYPDYTVKTIKMIYSWQQKGESIASIKKRFGMVFNLIERREKDLEESIRFICEAFHIEFDMGKYHSSREYKNNILQQYGEFIKDLAIKKLDAQHKILEGEDIKTALMIKKSA